MNAAIKLLLGKQIRRANQVTLSLAGLLFSASTMASILSFDFSISNSRFDVSGNETAHSLIGAHNSGNLVCADSVSGFVRMGPRQSCGQFTRNYSMRLTATFSIDRNEQFIFQTGADWGRGGGIVFENRQDSALSLLTLRSDDVWWRRNWNNKDVFTTQLDLTPGDYALSWIGFEDCCAGETTLRFRTAAGEYQELTKENFGASLTAVTEPGTFALLGLGLAGFIMLRSRRSAYQAMRASQKEEKDAATGATPLSSLA